MILEGLTVNGRVELRGAEECAVRYCTVNAQFGIVAQDPPGAANCYIADNTVSYIMPWIRLGMGSGSSTAGRPVSARGSR